MVVPLGASSAGQDSKLKPGQYSAYWFSAIPEEKIELPPIEGQVWTPPVAPDRNDWALLLRNR
jgi:hypothetical protein